MNHFIDETYLLNTLGMVPDYDLDLMTPESLSPFINPTVMLKRSWRGWPPLPIAPLDYAPFVYLMSKSQCCSLKRVQMKESHFPCHSEGAGGDRRISNFLENQRFFTPLRSVQNDITGGQCCSLKFWVFRWSLGPGVNGQGPRLWRVPVLQARWQ